jgi:hypothetical protein
VGCLRRPADPPALGPLLDIAREAGGELAEVVAAEPTRHRLFSAFLDLLVFAGRRVAGTPAMVVVTYRDDEAGPGHPCGRPSATWPPPGGSTASSFRR